MRGIVRTGKDKTQGHPLCFPPTMFAEGSQYVFCNGLPIVLDGCKIFTHCCGPTCHQGTAQPSDGTFFIEGKKVQQKGDPVSCGDISAECSSDTL